MLPFEAQGVNFFLHEIFEGNFLRPGRKGGNFFEKSCPKFGQQCYNGSGFSCGKLSPMAFSAVEPVQHSGLAFFYVSAAGKFLKSAGASGRHGPIFPRASVTAGRSGRHSRQGRGPVADRSFSRKKARRRNHLQKYLTIFFTGGMESPFGNGQHSLV